MLADHDLLLAADLADRIRAHHEHGRHGTRFVTESPAHERGLLWRYAD